MDLRIRVARLVVQHLLCMAIVKAVTYSIRASANSVSLCIYQITTLYLRNPPKTLTGRRFHGLKCKFGKGSTF